MPRRAGGPTGMASWQWDCDEVRGVRSRCRCRGHRQAITHARRVCVETRSLTRQRQQLAGPHLHHMRAGGRVAGPRVQQVLQPLHGRAHRLGHVRQHQLEQGPQRRQAGRARRVAGWEERGGGGASIGYILISQCLPLKPLQNRLKKRVPTSYE